MKLAQLRRILGVLAVILGTVIALPSTAVASADASHAGSGPRVGAPHGFDGQTRAELMAAVWRHGYTNTFGPCLRVGDTGRVLLLSGEETCTMKEGEAVISFFGSTCDDVVDPSVDPTFYGGDAAAQRRCAVAWDRENILDEWVAVDGARPVHLVNRRFEVASCQQHVFMPEGNFYGVSARNVTFVAHAWVALTTGLRPGLHTIEFAFTIKGEEPSVSTHTVNVVPRHQA